MQTSLNISLLTFLFLVIAVNSKVAVVCVWYMLSLYLLAALFFCFLLV